MKWNKNVCKLSCQFISGKIQNKLNIAIDGFKSAEIPLTNAEIENIQFLITAFVKTTCGMCSNFYPKSVVGSAIWMCTDVRITQLDIKDITGVTQTTISKCWREFYEIIPDIARKFDAHRHLQEDPMTTNIDISDIVWEELGSAIDKCIDANTPLTNAEIEDIRLLITGFLKATCGECLTFSPQSVVGAAIWKATDDRIKYRDVKSISAVSQIAIRKCKTEFHRVTPVIARDFEARDARRQKERRDKIYDTHVSGE